MDSRSRPESRENLADIAARSRAATLVGTVISQRYRIVDLLAMGGVGAVYLAEHVHMQKHVAVKVLHPDSAGLPDLVARFEREAVAGAHVQHPNVAAATDFGELPDGSFFLVLEYVRGTTLREVIRRGPLPSARTARIGRQIAAGLGAAHAMGIVHRDLKPRNVMLIEGERDMVKLIDFGIARLDLKQVSAVAASRAAPIDDRITTSGAVFGTIAYLAPEAALGMDTVDARADLYALGVVLYEMLAGKHPFETNDPVALFKMHAQRPVPPSRSGRRRSSCRPRWRPSCGVCSRRRPTRGTRRRRPSWRRSTPRSTWGRPRCHRCRSGRRRRSSRGRRSCRRRSCRAGWRAGCRRRPRRGRRR